MAVNAISSLPVLMRHALRVYELPDHHRDPFDRMLVSQAQLEFGEAAKKRYVWFSDTGCVISLKPRVGHRIATTEGIPTLNKQGLLLSSLL